MSSKLFRVFSALLMVAMISGVSAHAGNPNDETGMGQEVEDSSLGAGNGVGGGNASVGAPATYQPNSPVAGGPRNPASGGGGAGSGGDDGSSGRGRGPNEGHTRTRGSSAKGI